MFQEDIALTREIAKEEIALALASKKEVVIPPIAWVESKTETPKKLTK